MKRRKPLQKATVIKKAQDKSQDTAETLDKGLLAKIQKCLSRAAHETTTESEAKAALFVAHKLMAQYNVSQADLVANSDDGSKARYGGRSTVAITNIKEQTRRVIKEAFVDKLANAMCRFFDCKCFSTNYPTSMNWTFFGIAKNTIAAAMAFEMAHNKILEWACAYKGGSTTFSYRIGVADGLVAMANREKKIELEAVRKKELDMIAVREREEREERERGIERLKVSSLALDLAESEDEAKNENPCFLEIDSMFDEPSSPLGPMDTDSINGREGLADFNESDENVIDLSGDVDDNIDKIIKRESRETLDFHSIPTPSVKQESATENSASVKSEGTSSSPWASETQLVRFRATSVQVADDYLKSHNIKLLKTKSRKVVTRDSCAYRQGWEDSEKIDFRQRSLE
jgi:hypothetical protein